jgi:hypothetical protein
MLKGMDEQEQSATRQWSDQKGLGMVDMDLPRQRMRWIIERVAALFAASHLVAASSIEY